MPIINRLLILLPFSRRLSNPASFGPPLRSELYGLERLEELAVSLAKSDQVTDHPRARRWLTAQLNENKDTLYKAYRIFQELARKGGSISPAAEWLLDNFYIVQDQFREVQQDLNQGYYRELPVLTNGSYTGYPRVYGLAVEVISHTDSRLDAEALKRIVRAYQTVAVLTSGELWAIAIMLRLALIENLRRLMDESVASVEKRALADKWADRMLELPIKPATEMLVMVAELARTFPKIDPIFGVQLLRRLQNQHPHVAPSIKWLEERLTEQGGDVQNLIREEHQRLAANRVSIGNVITSMRALGTIDWATFYELTSLSEQILRADPISEYERMDFASRDLYRHVVENLSRRSNLREDQVASRAVYLAHRWLQRNEGGGEESKQAHVGYYLLDRGLDQLKEAIGYRPRLEDNLAAIGAAHPTLIYLGSIALITLLVLWSELIYASQAGGGLLIMLLVAFVASIPTCSLAIAIVDRTVTAALKPRVLPKLEFKGYIPEKYLTIVAVPALISSKSGIAYLLAGLENRLLSNRDSNLYFALLTDFGDAPKQEMPEDAELLDAVSQGIRDLNAKYARTEGERFFLFHRQRLWNPEEGVWMGWERKRGKLNQFNKLLRGDTNTSYVVQIGDLSVVPRIKLVITLDADTLLPLNSAKRLVGTIAHPLNRARLDPETQHVIEGYGIIQPRTSVNTLGATRSLFDRIFSGDIGLDPYSHAVSNVYQDLFGTGIYVGKGIYDVDIALATLADRFPENRLLSHDLLEGLYARTGLATDIQLLEDFPSGFDAYQQREHRWVRGDWQIADWLSPFVPSNSGRRVKNALSLIDRWKIFDNLRRSLEAPFLLILLCLSWTLLPGAPLFWTAISLFFLLFSYLLNVIAILGSHPPGEPLRGYIWASAHDAALNGVRGVLVLTLLLPEALLHLDAIARSLVRTYITHRSMLQWTSSAAAERRQARTLMDYWIKNWISTAVAFGIVMIVILVAPANILFAGPLIVLWGASPSIAFLVSLPFTKREAPLPGEGYVDLRRYARSTWRYFEEFVCPEDHWLPPDHYQENPNGVTAHRTSPTNIGFYLLSAIAAFDLGYVGITELADRLEKTIGTLTQMEKFRGHLLNWFDTLTLTPLIPKYVSSVDSGNLVACLITVRQACELVVNAPVISSSTMEGLLDTTKALQSAGDPISASPSANGHAPKEMSKFVMEVIGQLTESIGRSEDRANNASLGLLRVLEELEEPIGKIQELAQSVESHQKQEGSSDFIFWSWKIKAQYDAIKSEAKLLNLDNGPNGDNYQSTSPIPSLSQIASLNITTDMPGAAHEGGPAKEARELMARFRAIAERADALITGTDFRFLYDDSREAFSTGYNITSGRLDGSYYDLLASEARLASFIAIAMGQVPERHWFQLGRPLTRAKGRLILLSWGGTMFEFLMPPLLMSDQSHTLLDQTYRGVVERQIEYGAERKIPWGVSECGFYAFDFQLNYQYRMFGVPDTGLKREAGGDMVVAPYASFLALSFSPRAAWANLRRLETEKMFGQYGFYEAIDYTPTRVPTGERAGRVQSFMSHHQGMSLVALDNFLMGDKMKQRFNSDSAMAASDVILQERIPLHAAQISVHHVEPTRVTPMMLQAGETDRHFTTPHTLTPYAHILSNGSYTVLLTNSGSGYSSFRDLLVTRWREDRTRDQWGSYCNIKDIATGELWSVGFHPAMSESDEYQVTFRLDKAEFARRDYGIETRMEVWVSPEHNAEVRRVTIRNTSRRTRTLDLTTYAEVVLQRLSSDAAHPAFGNLFIESEFVAQRHALLFKRRPRASDERAIWAIHMLAVEGKPIEWLEYETDRARFLGRGKTSTNAEALNRPLTRTVGAVLDPMMSLRYRLQLGAGQIVRLAFTTGAADSREGVMAIADQLSDVRDVDRIADLAYARSEIQRRHLNITAEEAQIFQRLSSAVIYPEPRLRAPQDSIERNNRGQAALWAYGISGDYPIVLVRVDDQEELDLVRQAILALEFWRLNNFTVDLVILDGHPTSYIEGFHSQIQGIIDTSLARPWIDRPGGVFLRREDQMTEDDRLALQSVARVILDGENGNLAAQLEPTAQVMSSSPPRKPKAGSPIKRESSAGTLSSSRARELVFDNGTGGFTQDGKEYVITLSGDSWTPAPWANVLANPQFGCLVTESGLGYSWWLNAQMNRLTPWSNDPVSDAQGQALYIADEVSGEIWSPTPLPIREDEPYTIHHGAGYTRYEHTSHSLAQDLVVFVPKDDPILVLRLNLRNLSNLPRVIRVTGYFEWVLGTIREQTQYTVVTSHDSESESIFARNTFNAEFGQRIAFASINRPLTGYTADRTEFIGRNGSPSAPMGLSQGKLSGTTGAGFDPCAALQTRVELLPREQVEVVFLIGHAQDERDARILINRYQDQVRIRAGLEQVKRQWDDLLSAVQVRTPEPAMDMLLNRWLLYQVLACRYWGRTGFYQSGGAYGFRDQLQDVMACIHSSSGLTREHILRAASRQFVEGDVQHWWHPPLGAGLRTRISDDSLWLIFATCYYVESTGDSSILDEKIHFLKAPRLEDGQTESYARPSVSEEGTLYEHCVRAIESSLNKGDHGLPLMGTGDWNDGMNRVGVRGKGESVWLGWFLYQNLSSFAKIPESRGDTERAAEYREHAEQLKQSLNTNGWDGKWYLRAFFDDGSPLGSAQNEQCVIDSIAQSWAIISQAGYPERNNQSLKSVEEMLVRDKDNLVLLLTPPFDQPKLDPGYIAGYLPGIRENGGQYTHAALWLVEAYARLGNGNRAMELYKMLNPINHATSNDATEKYKVEPYAVVGDVYSHPAHLGRGGWSWYTGSAGWMYRVGIEDILGLRRKGAALQIDPCIPSEWSSFQMTYKFGTGHYEITVNNPEHVNRGVVRIELDGAKIDRDAIPLVADGTHQVIVHLGKSTAI